MAKPDQEARFAKASPAAAARQPRMYMRNKNRTHSTRAKMRAFLEALAGTASVADAAAQVGLSRQSRL